MRNVLLIALMSAAMAVSGCQSKVEEISEPAAESSDQPILRVMLDLEDPAKSTGILTTTDSKRAFPIGYGKNGISCEGSRFSEGVTPIGRFRVNAVLSQNDFKMDPELISQSGKSEQDLKDTLFRNMNSIDFKGDGETGEYGIGYISLAPVPSTPQPFAFNEYAGTFRWYSFAIHGTNNESRVGKTVTGGCLNVKQEDLKALLSTLELGDEVEITGNGPCDAT